MNAARKPRCYLAKSIASLLAGYFVLEAHTCFAQPRGQQVVSGQASFDLRGRDMTIRASDRSIINYQSFNIGSGEKVQFIQPSSSSRVLNRVTDPSPTHLFGMLQANGQVYLVNPAGIFFENGSVINVGGLFAAAGHMSDQDFLGGKNLFTQLSADVVNRGMINSVGDVGLFGANVANFGTITSQTGVVAMLAGDQVLIGEKGSNIFVGTSPAAALVASAKPGVQNAGTIQAPRAVLGAGDMYAMAIVNSGKIASPDITLRGGKNGQVAVSGTLDASVHAPGKIGGKIKVLGGKVALRAANLDASGDAGGGEILVGGDTHGGNGVQTASTTSVDAATTIKADALTSGAGGKVVVWSDIHTDFAGAISARGAGTGAGGFSEVSGKLLLAFTGTVNLTALSGHTGSLLLDPSQITIGAGGDSNITGSSPFTDNGDSPAGNTMSTLNVTTLQNALSAADVLVDATGGTGVQMSPSITVANPVSWANANTLTLTAGAGGIAVNAAITAATGALTLNSGAGITETGGSVAVATLTTNSVTGQTLNGANTVSSFNAANTTSGNIALTNAAAPLTITGISQMGNGTTTVNNTGALTTTGAVTTTGTGAINLQASGTETIGAAITASASPANVMLTSTGGNLALNASVDAGTGSVALSAPNGTISQGGGTITAGALGIEATATPSLTLAGLVSTIAANITGMNNPFSFSQAGTFDVGTVSRVISGVASDIVGVTTQNGLISLTATAGDLTLSQNVNSNGAAVNLTSSTGTITNSATVSGGSAAFMASTIFLAFSGTAVNTTADQNYNGKVVLNADTTLTSTVNGNITFTDTVNSPAGKLWTLTVTAPGTTTFDKAVGATGTELGALTIDPAGTANGTTDLNGGTVLTLSDGLGGIRTGNQTYNDAVVLTADTALTAEGALLVKPNVTFAQTVNSQAGKLWTLAVTAPGTTTFDKAVGATGTELGALTIDPSGTANGTTDLNGGTVLTLSDGLGGIRTGNQTYNDAVVLTADTALTAEGALLVKPNVTFAQTVNSQAGGLWTLTVTAPGTTTFDKAVGAMGTELGALTIDPSGTANGTTDLNGATILTLSDGMGGIRTGNQTYNDAVVLTADTTLTAEGALLVKPNVTFAQTVNSQAGKLWTLTVTAPGMTTFDGAVGAVGTELGALTIDPSGTANGTTDLNGATVLTLSDGLGGIRTGNQTYNDAVVLTADTALTAEGALLVKPNVTFAQTVNSQAGKLWTLTVTAPGTTTFDKAVGAVGTELGALTIDPLGTANGTTDLNGATVLTLSDGLGGIRTGNQTYNDAVVLTADTTLTAEGALLVKPNVTFAQTVDGAHTLEVNTVGNEIFDGVVGGKTALTSLTTDVVLVGGAAQFNMTAPGAVNPAGVNAGTVTINDAVVFNVGGSLTAAPSVQTAGSQTYNGLATLSKDTVLKDTAGGNITFALTVDGAYALEADSTGNEIFNGVVGGKTALMSLTTDVVLAGGAAQFNMTAPGAANPAGVNAGTVTTFDDTVVFNVENVSTSSVPQRPSVLTMGGGQHYSSHGDLQTNTFLKDSATGDIEFTPSKLTPTPGGNTILAVDAHTEGGESLLVDTGGAARFSGAVGGLHRLSSLTTSAINRTEFNLPTKVPPLVFPTNGAWVNVVGDVLVNYPVVFNVLGSSSASPTVDTGGNQTYLGAATLLQNTFVHSGGTGNIKFDKTITGPYSMAINAAGYAMLNGNVTTASLDVAGSAGIQLAAYTPITISTTGSQSYDNNVALLNSVTSTSSSFPITFKGRTDGPGGLTVTTPGSTVTFTGAVGSFIPVDFLQVRAGTIRVADVTAGNDASLDATDLLFLNGDTYTAGGTLAFNPSARFNVSGSSSIVRATGNLSLSASTFMMGLQQKMIVNAGSLTITAGSASLGDIGAARSMTLDIGSITILGRPAGGFVNANRRDQGVSFVSPIITVNGSITGVAPGGRVNFGTFSGIVDGGNNVFSVPGVSVFQQTDLANQFNHAGNEFGTFLQPIAGGLVTTLNSAVNPLVPVVFELPQPFLFETDSPISLALIEELIRLGINAREATTEEKLSINIREGVFNQPQDYVEPEDVGYQVVVNRVTTGEVKRVTKLFEQIGGEQGLASIQQIMDAAVTKYFSETKAEDVNGDKFLSWLQQKSGSDPAAQQGLAQMQKLASLYNEIEQMGLTDAEVSRSEEIIAKKVNLQGPLTSQELKNAVKKLQSATPKKPLEASKKKGPNQASRENAETPPKHGSS